jgi:hypothetical protein
MSAIKTLTRLQDTRISVGLPNAKSTHLLDKTSARISIVANTAQLPP